MKNSLFALQLTFDTFHYSLENRKKFFKEFQVLVLISLISKWTSIISDFSLGMRQEMFEIIYSIQVN